MPSAGIMASSVVLPSGVDVLLEPFDNYTFAPWTVTGTATIVAGRTGNAAQAGGSTARADYNIAAPGQADTLTVGFAWRRTDAITNQRDILGLWSDSGATRHNRITYQPGITQLSVTRDTTPLASNSTITMATNTWYYIECQIRLHDTAGTAIVRIDGTEVINAAALDTKNAGTKTVYDQIRIGAVAAGATGQYDDLYVTAGAGAPFQGDHTIP